MLKSHKLFLSNIIVASLLAPNINYSHTTSIGYTNTGQNAVTFWYGTYHNGTNFTEGQLKLEGINGTNFDEQTVSFTTVVQEKPDGLNDGDNNFFTNGTVLVGNFNESSYQGTIHAWQGVEFTDLNAGNYRFTYIPIAQPTATWDPWDDVILTSTVELTAEIVQGTPTGRFIPVANKYNSEAARRLDWLLSNSSGDLRTILNSISGLSDEDRARILNRLSPNTGVSVLQASLQTVGSGLDSVQSRLNHLRTGYGSMNISGLTGLSSGDYTLQILDNNIWLKGFGGHTNQQKYDGFSGFHTVTYGATVGYDNKLNIKNSSLDDFVVGVAATYARTNVDFKDLRKGDDAHVNTYQVTGYATKELSKWYTESMLAVAHQDYESTRNTFVAGIAKSDYSGYQVSFRTVAGMPLIIEQMPDVRLVPQIGLEASYVKQDGVTEKGAGPLSMKISSDSTKRLRSLVGTALERTFKINTHTDLLATSHLVWRHDFVRDGASPTALFVGDGGSFNTTGQKINADAANIGGSLAVEKDDYVNFIVQADAEFASKYTSYSGQALVRYNF